MWTVLYIAEKMRGARRKILRIFFTEKQVTPLTWHIRLSISFT